jgi:hypothetical protein
MRVCPTWMLAAVVFELTPGYFIRGICVIGPVTLPLSNRVFDKLY